MVREAITEVLVVGAGPVGMTTALMLAERGVETTLIDAAGGRAAHSYACALHPHSLELLDHFGLSDEILESGQRVNTVAFYEGAQRWAEIRLSELAVKFPFVVVLPQSSLEELLERTLERRAGIKINWHHRLSYLQSSQYGVEAAVDKLGGTSLGYIVPHWEVIVERTTQINTPYLVGADGHDSMVRRCLGIDYEQVGEPELFAVFEFETASQQNDEVRVVMDDSATSVLWPLPGRHCRWSFQLAHTEARAEFPPKQRRSIWIDDPESNERVKRYLLKLAKERAPWFADEVKEFDWVTCVQFGRRLAKQFGDGHCWLVGDAAHQTGPVGAQSVNVGLREVEGLADALNDRLHGVATDHDPFDTWNRHWRAEWQQLLGLTGCPKASGLADGLVARRAARILPCLPASGEDLAQCLKQFHLDLT